VLGLIATLAYVTVDADNRPAVVRLAVAAFVAVVLMHIHGHFTSELELAPPSAFDQAKQAQTAEAKVAPAVARLAEQVTASVASQRHFQNSLWPRLVRLSEKRGTTGQLLELQGRRWRRRGPSLSAIAGLVRRIGDDR
jgi:hypothetical protein